MVTIITDKAETQQSSGTSLEYRTHQVSPCNGHRLLGYSMPLLPREGAGVVLALQSEGRKHY